jgi:hypothetical protein
MTNQPVILMHDRPPALSRGRLIFGLDATASREATWDIARDLQAKMFRDAAPIGQLECQLVYFRGHECRASKWVSDGNRLAQLMKLIECQGGFTQIGRVLTHVLNETEKAKVEALVFIGDAMEENLKELANAAGELGARGVPIFAFHEPRLPPAGPCETIADVRKAYRLLAMKSGGSYFEFNPEKPQALERSLGAIECSGPPCRWGHTGPRSIRRGCCFDGPTAAENRPNRNRWMT